MKQNRSDGDIPVPDLPPAYLTRDFSKGRRSLVAGTGARGEETMAVLLGGVMKPQPQANRKLAELENRLARLEATAPRYRDVWQRGKAYAPMDTVTHAGALWIARGDGPTTDRPGTSGAWKLMTKTKDR
jgi:hypothetical protein